MIEQYPPERLRQYLRNAARVQNTDAAHAVAHILCSTDLPDRPDLLLPHLIVSLQGPAGDMHTTARVKDWSRLLNVLAFNVHDGRSNLLKLARSLADGTAVDVRALCRGLSAHHAGIITEAVLIATSQQARYVLEPVTDPDMRKLTDVAHLLHARIVELAVEHHDQQMRSTAPDDAAGILVIKTAVDVVGRLATQARDQIMQRLTPTR
ncbi:hypothetical protein [Catellatospora methionotrophica]|uniref:hypothetical protein n=1 Tax=Catellatospora methionotrophica TaxID=121620 RepID=UPI0033EB4DB4